jgi:hypothetical protein
MTTASRWLTELYTDNTPTAVVAGASTGIGFLTVESAAR